MSSTLIRAVVGLGIMAAIAINVIAPRLGIEHPSAAPPPAAPIVSGPRLVPVPADMPR